ncbi:MAG: D-alanine--D-alanine ligase family protein [Dehalococcoidia bacterium]
MAKTKVGILFGGRSGEHEVSVVSAQGVLMAIDTERYEPVPLAITRDGIWLTPEESREALRQLAPGRYLQVPQLSDTPPLRRPEVMAALAELDIAFPLIHGPYGEDGSLQGLLQVLGVPYVGAGVAASAVGLDKELQKAIWRQASLPVVPHVTIRRLDWERDAERVQRKIETCLAYPAFVKPANGGSSVGITRLRSREDLAEGMALALDYGGKALVEKAMVAHEVECAVLGNDAPEASPLGEIIPHREFYDYEAKYLDDGTEYAIPPRIPAEWHEPIREMAIAAYRAIGCEGMARVDFFVEDNGTIYLNEINTIPGFTPISMYPRLWESAGLTYTELIGRLIELGLERFQKAQK